MDLLGRIRSRIDARTASDSAFILFFTYKAWFTVFRLSITRVSTGLSLLLIYVFVFIAVCLSRRRKQDLAAAVFVVGLCAAVFAVTYAMHPEYGKWFFENPDYGLFASVFYPSDGIFAFLFVCLCESDEDLRRNMRIVAWIMLLFAAYQLIPVIRTGHWNTAARTGLRTNQSTYSLGFGYRTILCVMVFWNEFRTGGKYLYLAMSGLSLVMVLKYGGRGCLLALAVFLLLRYMVHARNQGWKNALIVAAALFVFWLWYSETYIALIQFAAAHAGKLGQSRTVQKLLDGTFFEDNARKRIWALSAGIIRDNWPFGRGAYGDRLIIGQYYSWGYSHDIFLEMMVTFGAAGAVIMALFILGIVRFVTDRKNDGCVDVFLVFVGLACQLLVSDSFWYNTAFWAILAMMYKGLVRGPVRKVGNRYEQSPRPVALEDNQYDF